MLENYFGCEQIAMNELVTVRSEERAIYTQGRNPTGQIYVGSFNIDLGTSDL